MPEESSRYVIDWWWSVWHVASTLALSALVQAWGDGRERVHEETGVFGQCLANGAFEPTCS